MDQELISDLKQLAAKHSISYTTLMYCMKDMLDDENRYTDIRTLLCDEYPEIALTDENITIICERFIKSEDANHGLWDNIRNAIEYVKDELEQAKEEQ